MSHTIKTDADLITAAQAIKKTYDLQWLLATRGKLGMCLVGEETEPFLVPAQAREVFDVSGAGDTVIATMAWCLAGGLSFKQAVEIANVAAGVVVGRLGTQPITDTGLKAAWTLYASDNNFPNSSKINSLEVCLARVTHR